MNQRMAKIKPPEETNSVEAEPLDLGVFSKFNLGRRDLSGHLASNFFCKVTIRRPLCVISKPVVV